MRIALLATTALFFRSDIASARAEEPPLVRSLRLFGTSVLTFAALLSISQPAQSQFIQQGPKLVGTGVLGGPPVGFVDQGFSVALSADGNTAIVGGPLDNSETGQRGTSTAAGGFIDISQSCTQQPLRLLPNTGWLNL
jgi:hypothetical protein